MRAFHLTKEEILTASLRRFEEEFGSGDVARMPDKSSLVGGVDFGIARLLAARDLPFESPEFVRFARHLRATPGAVALMSLKTPDYGLLCMASAKNMMTVRRGGDLEIRVGWTQLSICVHEDIVVSREYCRAAGLLADFNAHHYGALHIHVTELYEEIA